MHIARPEECMRSCLPVFFSARGQVFVVLENTSANAFSQPPILHLGMFLLFGQERHESCLCLWVLAHGAA